jgi:hypothetical protein
MGENLYRGAAGCRRQKRRSFMQPALAREPAVVNSNEIDESPWRLSAWLVTPQQNWDSQTPRF